MEVVGVLRQTVRLYYDLVLAGIEVLNSCLGRFPDTFVKGKGQGNGFGGLRPTAAGCFPVLLVPVLLAPVLPQAAKDNTIADARVSDMIFFPVFI